MFRKVYPEKRFDFERRPELVTSLELTQLFFSLDVELSLDNKQTRKLPRLCNYCLIKLFVMTSPEEITFKI